MAKRRTNQTFKGSSQDESKGFAFLATFLSIIGFVIAIVAKKDDKYVMFYAKQSLVVFIAACIAWIVQILVLWIPILGGAISVVISLVIFLLWIFSWIYALSGDKKEVPFIGQYANKIKL